MQSNLTAASLKKMICYLYMLDYCPPAQLEAFNRAARQMRLQAALDNGMPEVDFTATAIPEASRRILSYHLGNPLPEPAQVEALQFAALAAGSSTAALEQFQQLMQGIVVLPGRADLKNRLHRKRGCAFCSAPCAYGFFTLVSSPMFKLLQEVLEKEAGKPPAEQRLLLVLWAFTRHHLRMTMGTNQDFITPEHLGNLAFCLYLLSTAKSRYLFKENVIRVLQEANQHLVVQRSRSPV